MEKKKIGIALAALLIAAGGWYYKVSHEDNEFKLYGNIDIRQVSLAFNASERIAKMHVEEGAKVTKGQVLAELETTPLKLNIAKLEAQVAMQQALVEKLENGNRPEEIAQADAAVRAAEAEFNDAQIDKQRLQSLYLENAIAKKSLDSAAARLETAAANLRSAQEGQNLAHIGARSEDIAAQKAQLRAYEEELKVQKYNLSQTTLVAPVDGVIRSRLLEPGDMASANKAVYLLSANEKKWARVYVPEKRLGLLKEGMAAEVYSDSFPDKPLQGSVGYISDTAEFTPKSVQTEELRTALLYEVRVNINDENNVLRMGMPVTVRFPDL
ncbi:MAG: efflux RND transporter periplasmic adaptor subunit [Phascolarctobacterium sp.]|nr:efflux RND transporter periplasmic adaptor subunit [Phascolarctobacterium sp.]